MSLRFAKFVLHCQKTCFPCGIHVTRKRGPHNAASSSSELSSELPYARISIGRTQRRERSVPPALERQAPPLGGAARGPGRNLAQTSRTGPRRPLDRAGPACCGSRPGCSWFRSSSSFGPRGYRPRPLGGSTHARAGGRGKVTVRARAGLRAPASSGGGKSHACVRVCTRGCRCSGTGVGPVPPFLYQRPVHIMCMSCT